jgi:hypothetical protein
MKQTRILSWSPSGKTLPATANDQPERMHFGSLECGHLIEVSTYSMLFRYRNGQCTCRECTNE